MATPQDVPTTDGMYQALCWFKEAISNEVDAKIALNAGGASNALTGVSVDGTIQPVKNKIAILGLSAYAKKTDVASGYHYKGSVNNYSDLPQSGMSEGDMYNILTTGGTDTNGDPVKAGDNVAWTGSGWDVLSGMVDLSNCVMKVPGKDLSANDFTNADKAKLDSLTNSTYTLPTAGASVKGGIKVGTGLSMSGDTLNVTMVAAPSYTMPTASTTTKGGVKIGHGLQMQGETLNALASSYTLPTASATMKGGVKVGTGLQMNGDTLEAITPPQYTLPTASATQKGGVVIGAGLSMSGDTLNCTVSGGGGTYNDFTGATSIAGGASGLVPAPLAGADSKFLCGNGKWEDISKHVSIVNAGGSIGVVVGTDPTAVQGALWMDYTSDGTTVLKLRHNDTEYNFRPDSSSYAGSALPALDTSVKGQIYLLDTVAPATNGGLWYKLDNSVPKLGLHYGKNIIFDYFYNYDTVTYKGGAEHLCAYLPCNALPITDALNNNVFKFQDPNSAFTILSGTPLYGGYALTGTNTAPVSTNTRIITDIFSGSSMPKATIDCWFMLRSSASSVTANVYIFRNPIMITILKNNGGLKIDTETYPLSNFINTPHHLAFLYQTPGSISTGSVALDGHIILSNVSISWGFTASISCHFAINKIRAFDKLIWDGNTDIDVPTIDTYF